MLRVVVELHCLLNLLACSDWLSQAVEFVPCWYITAICTFEFPLTVQDGQQILHRARTLRVTRAPRSVISSLRRAVCAACNQAMMTPSYSSAVFSLHKAAVSRFMACRLGDSDKTLSLSAALPSASLTAPASPSSSSSARDDDESASVYRLLDGRPPSIGDFDGTELKQLISKNIIAKTCSLAL
jgi:hypothetical protein